KPTSLHLDLLYSEALPAWGKQSPRPGGALSLLQPGRAEQYQCRVVEGIIFHRITMGLEEGITSDVHPVELCSDQALHIGADLLPFCLNQRASPLPHHLLQAGIVNTHVIRLLALEETHRALVNIAQGTKAVDRHVKVVLDQHAIHKGGGV